MVSVLLERMMGIEPTRSAWKAEVLPLNYIRVFTTLLLYQKFIVLSMRFIKIILLTLNVYQGII